MILLRIALAVGINALALWVANAIWDSVSIHGFWAYFIGALVLGIANAVIKPILAILTLPLIIFTLGLFYLLINIAMVALAEWIAPNFSIDGFWTYVGVVVDRLARELGLLLGARRARGRPRPRPHGRVAPDVRARVARHPHRAVRAQGEKGSRPGGERAEYARRLRIDPVDEALLLVRDPQRPVGGDRAVRERATEREPGRRRGRSRRGRGRCRPPGSRGRERRRRTRTALARRPGRARSLPFVGSSRAISVAERPKPTQRRPPETCRPVGRGPIAMRRTTRSERGSTSTSFPASQAVTHTRPKAAATSNGTPPTRTLRTRPDARVDARERAGLVVHDPERAESVRDREEPRPEA